MKIIQFEWEHATKYGIVDRDSIFSIEGNIYGNLNIGKKLCNLTDVRLLPPVRPKIVMGVGGNYPAILKESGHEIPKEPMLFLRPASCVIGHLGNIVYPKTSRNVNYGAELAVVIKHEAKDVPENRALDYVLGYTCGVDLTARDLLEKDGWRAVRAKSFPTSQPLGPCIATDINGDNLRIESRLNGILTQDGSTSNMIFSISKLISYITKFMILESGDVILTGQTRGETIIKVGDTIEVEIEGIGTLRNTVASA